MFSPTQLSMDPYAYTRASHQPKEQLLKPRAHKAAQGDTETSCVIVTWNRLFLKEAKSYFTFIPWRPWQLWAGVAGSWCPGSSWATAGLEGAAGGDEMGTQTWAGHQSHLPSVCLSPSPGHQSTAQQVLFKYSRAFRQETEGHAGVGWVNSHPQMVQEGSV